jgi:hypothetical protein
MNTIYQGLATRTSLTSLTLKYPSIRIARPTVIIPAMPNLTYLHLINLDPLCYPDDPSVLLLNCRKLEELKLEWSPRMRKEKEPSVSLHTYFGRLIAASTKLPVKRISLKNMFARNNNELQQTIDPTTIESATIINCIDPDDAGTVYNDETWLLQSRANFAPTYSNFKRLRIDRLDRHGAAPLGEFGCFTEIYFVNRGPELKDASRLQSPPSEESAPLENRANLDRGASIVYEATLALGETPPKSLESPASTTSPGKESPSCQVAHASSFLASITSRHGSTLTRLLLSDRWHLSREVVRNLVSSCPKLEQLGLALDSNDFELLRDVMLLCPKLHALRALIRADEPVYHLVASLESRFHVEAIGRETWRDQYRNLRWLGVGPTYFELGKVVGSGTEQQPYMRLVRPVSWEEIKHVHIFGMDTLDI